MSFLRAKWVYLQTSKPNSSIPRPKMVSISLLYTRLSVPGTNGEIVLLLHLYNNELEIAISSIIFNTNEITPRQSDLLLQASTSANAWLDIFLTIPAIEYTGFTFVIFSQISRCLLTLYRIATISQNSAIFQEENALKTTNPLPLLNQIIDKLVQVPVVSGLDACEQRGGDVFSRSAQLLRSFRSEWETKFDSDGMISGMADESYLMDLFDGFSDDLLYNGWFTEMPSF